MTPTQLRLIRRLSDGDYHSGQSLGEWLGVSRAAVWKQVQSLQVQGVEVERVRGKGYRIPTGLSLLDSDVINDQVPAPFRVEIHDSLPSTNGHLLDAVRGGEDIHGRVCLAEMQTAGRGRRGRPWQSPWGRNLYLSAGWRFERGVAAIEGLSLAVGLAVRRALAESFQLQPALKWPNDLLVADRKLGGILLEIAGDASGQCYVVMGVGLNVAMPAEAADKIDQPWIDLAEALGESGVARDRNRLVVGLLKALSEVLAAYETTGFAPYRQEWEAAAAFLGKRVSLSSPAGSQEGVLRGVTDSGALRLEVDAAEREFSGGELSLRGVSL